MTPGFPKKLAASIAVLSIAAAGINSFDRSGHSTATAEAIKASRPPPSSATTRAEAGSDSGRLLEELKSLTASGESADFQEFQTAIRSLAKADPKTASDFATSLANGSAREIALHRVAQAWAALDPQAAARWANDLRNQEERGMLLNGIFSEVSQSDPAKAIQMAETYDMLSFAPGMTANLVGQWAGRDYDSAFDWTASLSSGSTRDEALSRLAIIRSVTDPADAASIISDQITAGSIQEEAAITIVSRWASTDPDGAKAWAESFDAGALRERALGEITLASARASGP